MCDCVLSCIGIFTASTSVFIFPREDCADTVEGAAISSPRRQLDFKVPIALSSLFLSLSLSVLSLAWAAYLFFARFRAGLYVWHAKALRELIRLILTPSLAYAKI